MSTGAAPLLLLKEVAQFVERLLSQSRELPDSAPHALPAREPPRGVLPGSLAARSPGTHAVCRLAAPPRAGARLPSKLSGGFAMSREPWRRSLKPPAISRSSSAEVFINLPTVLWPNVAPESSRTANSRYLYALGHLAKHGDPWNN